MGDWDVETRRASGERDYEWAQFLNGRGVLERAEYEAKNEHFFRQYNAGELDIHEFLEFQLAPLARYPREKLDEWHAGFMRTKIEPMIRAKGVERALRHLGHGDLSASATSTNAFSNAPIARRVGPA